MKKIIYLSFLLPVLMAACTGSDSEYDSLDSEELNLVPVQEINDSDEILFGSIADVEITNDGKILVLDPTRKKMHLFDRDGNFLASALEEGRGPGEVQTTAYNFRVSPDNKITLFDQNQRRLSIYELTDKGLNPVQDINLELFPSHTYLHSNGNLFFHTSYSSSDEDGSEQILIMDQNGDIVKEPHITFEKGEELVITNTGGISRLSMSSDEHVKNRVYITDDVIIYNRSGSIGFKMFDTQTGELISETQIKRRPAPYPIDERREFVEGFGGMIGLAPNEISKYASDMPETKAIVRDLLYDKASGNVWLKILDPDDSADWLLFSKEGVLNGKLELPFEGEIVAVNDNRIYAKPPAESAPALLIYDVVE